MTAYNTSFQTTAVADTGVNSIDSLVDGNKWGGSVGQGVSLSYSFGFSAGSAFWYSSSTTGKYSTLNEPHATNAFALNATQQTAAQGALATWASVANLSFTQVSEAGTNVGDIRLTWTSAGVSGEWGHAYTPEPGSPASGDVWIYYSASSKTTTNPWAVGSYNYQALIHELGHALGLKHPGNYDVTGTAQSGPFLPASQDTRQYSVMSYNDIAKSVFLKATPVGSSYTFTYTTVVPETPMVLDIQAIQYLYGANMSWATGDNVYTFSPTTPFLKTIWDAGGNDTISVSNFSRGCVINLNPGSYSSIMIPTDPIPAGYSGGTVPNYTGENNLGIAYGTLIENAIGGSGNDTLIGNTADNVMTGNGGNDSIDGGSGTDTALYSASRSSYRLTKTTTGYTVADTRGAAGDGTDTLSNIERVKFSDTTVNLAVGDAARSISTTQLNSLIELYTAYLNRAPDADGMAYWIGQLGAGQSLTQIGTAFYSAAVQFASLTGYSANMTNADFVNIVYKNVLGRSSADAAGLAYWTGALASGQETRGSLVTTILNAAHGFKGDATWGYVANLLDNKVAVGKTFAITQGLVYNTDADSISQGMALSAAVTATDTSAALKLVGVTDTSFSLYT
jgi:hypothetical protein